MAVGHNQIPHAVLSARVRPHNQIPSEFQRQSPNSIVHYYRYAKGDLAAARRIATSVGKGAIDQIRNRQLGLDLILTADMINTWTATRIDTGDGLALSISIRNPQKYATNAHPKGTAKSRTFDSTDLPPILDEAERDLADKITEFTADRMGELFADLIVGSMEV